MGHWLMSGWRWEEETPLSSALGQKAFRSLLVQLFFFSFVIVLPYISPSLFPGETEVFPVNVAILESLEKEKVQGS